MEQELTTFKVSLDSSSDDSETISFRTEKNVLNQKQAYVGNKPQAHTNSTIYISLKWAFWSIMAAYAWIYGPCAIQFHVHVADTSIPGWFNKIWAIFSSESYQIGNGSLDREQHKFYFNNYLYFSFHSIAGGIWLMTGILQFVGQIRRHYHWIHRINGWIYATCVVFSLFGSFNLLKNSNNTYNNENHIISGPMFKTMLVALWQGAFISAFGGFYCILTRRVIIHRQFMVLSYCTAVGAAIFRWISVIFYNLDNKSTIETNNISVIMIDLAIMTIIGHLVISLGDTENQRNLERNIVYHVPPRAIASTNDNSKYVRRAMVFVVCSLVFITFSGPIKTGTWFINNYYKPAGWFDNYNENQLQNDYYFGSLRTLQFVSWNLFSYVSFFVLCMFRLSKYFGVLSKIRSKYEATIVLVFMCSIAMVGIITFTYIVTFNTGDDAFVLHSSQVFWSCNLVYLWAFGSIFGYNYYISKDFGRMYEALVRLVWCSLMYVILIHSIGYSNMWGFVQTLNEQLIAGEIVALETFLLFPAICNALESDWSVKLERAGTNRWPWKHLKCCNKAETEAKS